MRISGPQTSNIFELVSLIKKAFEAQATTAAPTDPRERLTVQSRAAQQNRKCRPEQSHAVDSRVKM